VRLNSALECSENRLRSPTAETVFTDYENFEAIGCGTNADSETALQMIRD